MTEDLKSNDRSNLTCIDGALLSLRIASGLAFLYHGGAILFGLFGGPGPRRFALDHGYPIVLGYLVGLAQVAGAIAVRSEEHTSELQSRGHLVCRLLLEKKNTKT